VGRTPETLIADLRVLDDVLTRDAVPELEPLEQLKPVKNPDLKLQLGELLAKALQRVDGGRLALSWPQERIDENGTASSYRIYGLGRSESGPFDDVPSLQILRSALEARDSRDLLGAANSVRVQLFRDAEGDEPISNAIPAIQWLAFEADVDNRRYCLHDGRGYLMDQDYAARLKARVEGIFQRDCGVTMPPWSAAYEEEKEYNIAAGPMLGAVVLDRTHMTTQLHRRGIEPCDLMTPDGLGIHVNSVDRSSSASHLIGQALVATDALMYDEEARSQLRKKIEAAGGDASWLSDRPSRVGLAIARSNAVTASDLFTFTQVTLARLDAVLASQGVTVYVLPIVRERG
jgi:uncharacterized protein (TIGR04141 family)